VVGLRGRRKTLCARVARPTWSSGPSTSPLELAGSAVHALNVVSLVGVCAMLSGFWGAWQAWLAFASRAWPTVPGRVLLSGVYGYSGFLAMYKAYVHYEYAVGGVKYDSKCIRFGGVNPWSPYMAASDANAFGEVQVHYDPRKPSRSCLIPGTNEGTIAAPIGVLVLGMLALALGVLH
jgi:hypothetical protein